MGIFLNQAGFNPKTQKKAILNFPADSFTITNASGKAVYSGSPISLGKDENSGDTVAIADFSCINDCGKYRLISGRESAEFVISNDSYSEVHNKLCKAYYFLRCGVELEEKYAGKFTHKACHCVKVHIWNMGDEIELEASGGWHDAGDYGRYVTAGAVAAAHLLYAYKLFPSVFQKQRLNIPESDSAVPDILEECRVELEWLMKMQREDGGAYHKLTTAQHAAFVMPEDDTNQLYMLNVSSMATADLAAVCALAAGIYEKYDSSFAQALRLTAVKAADWLEKNPDFLPFKNPEGCGTGEYGERSDRDNRFWAACELFALTGETKWQLAQESLSDELNLSALGYANVAGLGALCCITNKCGDANLLDRCKRAFIDRADELRSISEQNGYGDAMTEDDYHWGSNMVLMQNACIFAIADLLTSSRTYLPYVQAQADVLLGRNPLGISYVSGVGYHSIEHPHLRPVFADGIDECIPGMVSGGPNRHLSDPFAKRLLVAGTPPMKCFADDYMCYSLNEITIYWNSPAVFAFSYLLSV